MKTTNQDCRQFVQARKEFKANNLKGVVAGDLYIVYSYNWYPLFIHDGTRWYSNKQKYSVSTSKQYGQAHPLVDCVETTTYDLNAMILRHEINAMDKHRGVA